MATLESRTVIRNDEPAYRMLQGETGAAVPPLAARRDYFVVANPYSYTFQAYSSTGDPIARWGRDLPPRFLTDSEIAARAAVDRPPPGPYDLSKQQQRHFNTIAFDGADRLWVIGRVDGADFADVFADTLYLGRVPLPCELAGFQFALEGRWFAVLCKSDRPDSEVDLALYRIGVRDK